MYVYITTNPQKKVLYTGVTNNLPQRLIEHFMDRGTQNSFAGKYYCYLLIHFEVFKKPIDAIAREKEIKDWRRSKKEDLISQTNKGWEPLNSQLLDWPPKPRDLYHRGR